MLVEVEARVAAVNSEQRRLAGRYVLEAPIGHGGMGQVWRAVDTVLGRAVAVKTIDLRAVPDESGAARFEREARVTASLGHPNIVTVHDSGVEGDTAFLVMELLPGPSMAQRVAEGPLPLDEVVEVARQVASALDAAHSRGLVHRDIKPANVVYADDGRVRVLDFGITLIEDAGVAGSLTATHTVMGTAEYLAPEQAAGGRVDGRADLYALGCLVFTLLTGNPPFRGPTAVATMLLHASEPIPDVVALRPTTPRWLASLVEHLLAKDPRDRPVDAAAVAWALAEHRALDGPMPTTALAAPLGASGAVGAAGPSGAASTQRLSAMAPPSADAPWHAAPAGPPGPTHRTRGRSVAAWVLAGVAVLALAVVGWQVFGVGSEPNTGPATPPPSAAAPTTRAEPDPTPETSAPETSEPAPETSEPVPETSPPAPSAAEPAREALNAFSDRVRGLQDDGVLERDTARALVNRADDIQRALRRDDPDKVYQETNALFENYDERVRDGRIPPEADQELRPVVDDIRRTVDEYLGAEG
jgi:eukaryotic-like serine/threonine-protein kinase